VKTSLSLLVLVLVAPETSVAPPFLAGRCQQVLPTGHWSNLLVFFYNI
jgi:hypothetical protein